MGFTTRLHRKISVIPFGIDIRIGNPIFQILERFSVSPKQIQAFGITLPIIRVNGIILWSLRVVFHQIMVVFKIGLYVQSVLPYLLDSNERIYRSSYSWASLSKTAMASAQARRAAKSRRIFNSSRSVVLAPEGTQPQRL